MSNSAKWIRLASVSDIEVGTIHGVEVNGAYIALYHLEDGTICATDAVCTHAYALLTEGWLENGVIECPLHAGCFDVRTGKGLGAPIEEDLRTFEVKLSGDDIFVLIP